MAYSAEAIAKALVLLAAYQNNYDKAAKEAGVSVRSLKRWASGEQSAKNADTGDKNARNAESGTKNQTVAEGIETAIRTLLAAVPQMDGHDWAVALGILLDKWLLVNGQPTARTESLTRQVNELSDDEYRTAIAEAERIIADAAARSPGSP
jgi:hypothetical protein